MNRTLLISLISLTMAGCGTFKTYESPALSESVTGSVLTEADYSFANAQQPVSDWWTSFQDPQLSALVTQALTSNLDVRIAYANLQSARALSRAITSDRLPSVNANSSISRELNSNELPTSGVRAYDRYEAGFDASWELDLFDRVSEGIASQVAQEQAVAANLDQLYVTVAAEVARNYFELRGAQYRLNIAQRNANNQAETYTLTQNMLEAGSASALDVARAQTQMQLTKATIPPLKAQVTATINRLSVLTGQAPQSMAPSLSEMQALPSLPVTIAVGDVSSLLQRRPDIRSAERTVASTVADYNVAVAELFPKVNLLGSLGFISTNLSTFGTSALAGTIGPSLSWSVFDRNRLHAQVDYQDAQINVALANYEKSVLTALEETQTALSSFAHEESRRYQLQSAAASAKSAVDMAKQRFDSGYNSFLDVLDAERTLLEAEDSLALSEINSGLNLISIYKSLGGGWEVVPSTVEN